MEAVKYSLIVTLVGISWAAGLLAIPAFLYTGDGRYLLATAWGAFILWRLLR